MEFHEIAYSVAGAKSTDARELFGELPQDLMLPGEKKCITFMITVFDKDGSFPTITLLTEKYGPFKRKCRSMADIRSSFRELFNSRELDALSSDTSSAIADASNADDMKSKVAEIIGKHQSLDRPEIPTLDCLEAYYRDRKGRVGGFITGVKDLDDSTGGFQSGMLSTVAAWTSHGKSLFWLNASYLNALLGKKIVILSLEIPREMVFQQLLSRHSFKLGTNPLPYERFLKNTATEKEEEYFFGELLSDYKEIPGDIMVLEESNFSSFTREGVHSTLRHCERMMGGLDYFIVDHINLFQYVNPEAKLTGDHYVKIFADVAKGFRTEKGAMIGVGLAAQCNRLGWQRAARSEGRYNLLALSEFHEIERSSTYVVFLYADVSMMLHNEMKVQLVKHRIGQQMEDPGMTYVHAPCSVVGDSFSQQASSSSIASVVDSFFGDDDDEDDIYG